MSLAEFLLFRPRTRSNTKSSYSSTSLPVYKKLYDESKLKVARINKYKQKHQNAELKMLSNDLADKREKFFIPKINESSRKMVSAKRNASSTKILYDDALQRMKAAEIKLKQKEDIHKTHAFLPHSRKILYSNFEHKFDEVTKNLEIEEDDNAKVEYYQYLVVIKNLIFLDQDEEAKISENREVFEGWKAMKGDVYGFVTRAALKGLMIKALDLQPTSPTATKRDPSSYNTSKQNTETKENDKSGVQHTTIDLIKTNESEVRLDSIGSNTSSLSKIQNLYK